MPDGLQQHLPPAVSTPNYRCKFLRDLLQDWFERTVRIGLITILLAAVFQNYAYAAKGNIAVFYRTLLRLFCCATLFSFGMILKTLAAKMLSSHFNKSSYFDKMQDALRKVSHPTSFYPSVGHLSRLEGACGQPISLSRLVPPLLPFEPFFSASPSCPEETMLHHTALLSWAPTFPCLPSLKDTCAINPY